MQGWKSSEKMLVRGELGLKLGVDAQLQQFFVSYSTSSFDASEVASPSGSEVMSAVNWRSLWALDARERSVMIAPGRLQSEALELGKDLGSRCMFSFISNTRNVANALLVKSST